MSKNFTDIDPQKLSENIFDLIGDQWMLVTAGSPDNFNTMTASWGTAGILWNLPIAICFIRPQRHTYGFAQASEYYTLNFLEEGNKGILQFCGTRSGRDTNKISETGLIPLKTTSGNVYFEQCKLVFECKKLYSDQITADAFTVPELIDKNYPRKDFHRFFIGEIVSCLISD